MKQILGVYENPSRHWVGNGFHVSSLLSHHAHGRSLSPFLLLDHAEPTHFTPVKGRRGVTEHPHRGFETVTIVYQGEVEHRDSTGQGGVIGPDEVQWMTAGAGILHEELHSQAFAERGGVMEMVQLWVNLPAAHKMTAPGYQALGREDIPAVQLPDGAGVARIIAGEFGGQRGAAQTFTPINVWDLRLQRNGRASFEVPPGHSAHVVVINGTVQLNGSAVLRRGQWAALARDGDRFELEANNDAIVLFLGGEPIDEPIAAWGPMVMNTDAELDEALEDFRAGRFGRMPETTG